MTDERSEEKLRQLGRIAAADATAEAKHVDEPLVALMRTGDHDADLSDALAYVARCADCRARLTEGEVATRAVVVMAIEAPKTSQHVLARAAHGANARLVERGDGRWTAVVDAEKSESLIQQLEA